MTTPMYESIFSLKRKLTGSFHALPIQNINNTKEVTLCSSFEKKISELYLLESSITTPFFDNLTNPTSVINKSQVRLKEIYNSDQVYFVTCGSTISNKIVIEALCKKTDKVLCQNGVHQSIYFSIKSQGCKVDYIEDVISDKKSNIYAADTTNIIDKIKEAEDKKDPYTTIIINSQTYDGICYDLEKFLPLICETAKNVKNIIIDEAWGAWSYFDSSMKKKSAIYNSAKLSKKYDINFVVTHSIHKSLFALRQSSLINVFGKQDCQDKITFSHFRNHSTSPNYPILLSTELAIEHANTFSDEYSMRIKNLCESVREFIKNNLTLFYVKKLDLSDNYLTDDPTKIWITCKSKLLSGSKLRELLFNNYGIYVNRYSSDSILLNFHHGISVELVNKLENGLYEIDKKYKTKDDLIRVNVGDVANLFYILYPPGIPIITPGQVICNNVITKINQSIFDDTSLLIVEGN